MIFRLKKDICWINVACIGYVGKDEMIRGLLSVATLDIPE